MRHILVALVFCFAVIVGSAQKAERTPSKNDSLFTDMTFDMGERSPSVNLWYGGATSTRDGAGTIAPNAMYGVSLGMERERPWRHSDDIILHNGTSLYFAYGPAATGTLSASSSVDLMRFGFLDETGYGYRLGESSNISFLVGQSSLSWTNVKPSVLPINEPGQAQAIRDFEGGLRFSETMRPTVSWRIASPISLRVGYEWTQVYPRHMFWYWAMSSGIEGIADAAASWFAREIGKSSPAAMPIMYFVLRTGVAAGFKALRMNQMNWPFETAAPMNVQIWNVGTTIHF